MDDAFSFLRSAEIVVVLLVTGGLAFSWWRLFPRLKKKGQAKEYGIRAFGVPRTAEHADKILAAWRAARLESAAQRSITLDWFFIPLYVVAFGSAGVLVARFAEDRGGLDAGSAETVAVVLAIAAAVAGVFDVLENIGMKLMLRPGTVEPLVAIATTAVSGVKWLLIYGLLGSLVIVPAIGLLG